MSDYNTFQVLQGALAKVKTKISALSGDVSIAETEDADGFPVWSFTNTAGGESVSVTMSTDANNYPVWTIGGAE